MARDGEKVKDGEVRKGEKERVEVSSAERDKGDSEEAAVATAGRFKYGLRITCNTTALFVAFDYH